MKKNQYISENNKLSSRFDFIADAILAASRRFKKNVPFLYSFLDFTKLSLSYPVHLTLGNSPEDQSFFISSSPSINYQTDLRYRSTYSWNPGNSSISLDFIISTNDEEQIRECKQNISKLISCIESSGQIKSEDILVRLNEALIELYKQFSSNSKDIRSKQESKIKPNQKSIITEGVIKEILGKLSTYFEASLEGDFSVVRYFNSFDWKIRKITSVKKGNINSIELEEVPEYIAELVNNAFETGILQIGSGSNDTMCICVPCHLGGEPWVVSCIHIKKWPDDWWQAYTYYRDCVSKIFEEIRVSSHSIFAAEMLRLLKHGREKTLNHPDRTISQINEYWTQLGQIFPFSAPMLVSKSEFEKQTNVDVLLINGEEWCIDYYSAAPRFMSRFQLKAEEQDETWASLESKQIYIQTFLEPALSYLEFDNIKQRSEKYRDIAVGSYKIGHPMKRRVGSIQKAIGSLIYGLQQDNSKEQLLSLAQKASDRLEHIENLGHILDVISRALTKEAYENTFLSDGKEEYWITSKPFDFTIHLNKLILQVNDAEVIKDKKEIQLKWHTGHENTKIHPWIDNVARPSDIFYDEILWEILFNAFKKGKADHNGMVEIKIMPEQIHDHILNKEITAITFKNICGYEINPQSLQLILNSGWNRWNTSENAPVGGMYFIATFLQITNTGTLYAKIDTDRDNTTIFSVGLRLNGLKLT